MKYTGRVFVICLFVFVVSAWHGFYFALDYDASYHFFIEKGHLLWNFILVPLFLPFIWRLGKHYDISKYLSENDPLTNLHNRRFGMTVFPSLSSMIDRKDEKLCICMIDIDNFKYINDNFGHDQGDHVLQQVALMLKRIVRKSDIVIRWGGDEFLIIAPFMGKHDAAALSNRIERELKDSDVFRVDVSISMGVSEYPTDSETLEGLIKVADRHMFAMKKAQD